MSEKKQGKYVIRLLINEHVGDDKVVTIKEYLEACCGVKDLKGTLANALNDSMKFINNKVRKNEEIE